MVILALLGVASFVVGTEIINFYEYPDLCLNELKRGFAPVTPIPFLSWHKKGIKKGQGCVRFARKTSAWRLKSFKLACGSNRKDFLTSSSLVFRLIEQGRSGNWQTVFQIRYTIGYSFHFFNLICRRNLRYCLNLIYSRYVKIQPLQGC